MYNLLTLFIDYEKKETGILPSTESTNYIFLSVMIMFRLFSKSNGRLQFYLIILCCLLIFNIIGHLPIFLSFVILQIGL